MTHPPLWIRAIAFLFLLTNGIVLIEPAPTDLFFFLLLGAIALRPDVLRLRGFNMVTGLGILIFLFANGLSLMAADTHVAATRYLIITIYMFAVSVVLAGWIGRFGLAAGHWIVRGYCSGALVVGIIAILARFRAIPNPERFYLDDLGLRIQSTFKDPNVFAPYIVAALVLLLNDALTRRRGLVSSVVFGTVYALSILFAFSRGAFLHLGVSILTYAGIAVLLIRNPSLTRRLTIGSIAAVVLALTAGVYALAVFGLENFFAARLGVQNYDTERFAMQELTLHVSLDHPLGIGPGEWNVTRFPNDPHNVYLRVLAENGVLGVIGWLLWTGSCLFVGLRGAARRGPAAPLHAAAVAVLAGLLFESLFIDSLHWRHLFVVAALPLGLRMTELVDNPSTATSPVPAPTEEGLHGGLRA